jgi:hypothetical protein
MSGVTETAFMAVQLKGWTEAINSRAFALHYNVTPCRLDSLVWMLYKAELRELR